MVAKLWNINTSIRSGAKKSFLISGVGKIGQPHTQIKNEKELIYF